MRITRNTTWLISYHRPLSSASCKHKMYILFKVQTFLQLVPRVWNVSFINTDPSSRQLHTDFWLGSGDWLAPHWRTRDQGWVKPELPVPLRVPMCCYKVTGSTVCVMTISWMSLGPFKCYTFTPAAVSFKASTCQLRLLFFNFLFIYLNVVNEVDSE